MTDVDGVPEIVGGVFAGGGVLLTVTLNAGSAVVVLPSLTLMTMSLYVPTLPAPGVPRSRPVASVNVAHAGGFKTENVSESPSASLALGVKLY